MSAGVRVGVDIGGTFTDVIALDGGRVGVAKVLSTPDDLSRGVIDGIAVALEHLAVRAGDVGAVVHATTAATNALLERRGGTVGLLVTEGFGDILEIARQRRPDAYDLFADKLPPLVPRDHVVEIPERLRADGSVLRALDEDAVHAAWTQLEPLGVDAVAVAFLHSYADPRHERRAAAILAELVPDGTPVFTSHEVLAEPREFERTSTTVIAAYLSQVTSGYQRTLARRLGELGAPRRFWVMKSSGGLVASERAAAHPEELVESGPAAGVIAAAGSGKRLGLGDVLSFDMGGTTAKASLVLGGTPRLTWDYEVGGNAHSSGFLQRGSGHPLRVPVVDLAEVGTGGGSLAWIDEAGALRVGPRSAGADPGPACYGRGGTQPTVTDADAVLGYLNTGDAEDSDLGRLDLEAAREAIRAHVAEPLGLTVEAAAAGIFALANAQMASAVRLVSMAKGHDPRDFALMAFGGAGPVHAWAVADELEIGRVVIPPFAGINSAVGLLQADFRVDLGRGLRTTLTGERAGEIGATLRELGEEASAALLEQGHRAADIVIGYAADMRYAGQSYDVLVEFPRGADDLTALAAAFHAEHERAYGHAHPGDEVEVTVLRVSATAPGVGFDFGDARTSTAAETVRRVRFGDADHDARVVRRAAVTGTPVPGPALLEESQTTIVVPPHASAAADGAGFVTILLDRGAHRG